MAPILKSGDPLPEPRLNSRGESELSSLLTKIEGHLSVLRAKAEADVKAAEPKVLAVVKNVEAVLASGGQAVVSDAKGIVAEIKKEF
jgi:hypothetical protein